MILGSITLRYLHLVLETAKLTEHWTKSINEKTQKIHNDFSGGNVGANLGQKLAAPVLEVTHQRAVENQKILDAQMQRLAQEAAAKQAEAQRIAAIPRPHYEKQLVRAKTFEECHKGNVIDNVTLTCMKNHYEMVLVSGYQ